MAQKAIQLLGSPPPISSEVTSYVGWVSKPVVAQHLSMSLRSIDNLIASKKIPFAKFGRSIRFRLRDVDIALERFIRREAR